MPATQNVTFTFQDPSGNPIANGRVEVRLQQDISAGISSGPQVAAGIVVSSALDSNGTAVVSLWANDIDDAGTVYFVTAYSSLGQPVWQGETTVLPSYILLEDGTHIFLESGGPDAVLTE